MDKIEKIRIEIEMLKKYSHSMADNAINSNMLNFYDGEEDCCKQLLSFLDTLSEEPDKSLEEAANEFANQDCVTFISRKKGFIAGAEWQKEQMLKDAVEAYVNTYESIQGGSYVEFVADIPASNFKEKDKVRIVVLKEEEE